MKEKSKKKKNPRVIEKVLLNPQNRKIKKRRKQSFKSYIYKILKQIYPEKVGISEKAMAIINDFIMDMIVKFASEGKRLAEKVHRKVLLSRDILTTTRLLLTSNIAMHAINEAQRAEKRYLASKE